MSKKVGAEIILDKRLKNLSTNVERKLVTKVVPRAFAVGAKMMKASLKEQIIKDANSDNTGSRKLQSDTVKKKFPYRLKNTVRVKSKNNDHFVMKVVGVDRRGSHVNFDWGDKARKGGGRIHKLWWVKGVREKYAKVNPRVQRKDIPKIVMARDGARIALQIEKVIRRAVDKGELL